MGDPVIKFRKCPDCGEHTLRETYKRVGASGLPAASGGIRDVLDSRRCQNEDCPSRTRLAR